MTRTKPVRGERWQHHGGTMFEIVDTATHARTLEEQVLYRDPLAGARGRLWACSLTTFLGMHKGGVARFVRMPMPDPSPEEEAEWDALFMLLGGRRQPQTECA